MKMNFRKTKDVPQGMQRISQSQTLNEKAFKTTTKVGLKASLLLGILPAAGAANHKHWRQHLILLAYRQLRGTLAEFLGLQHRIPPSSPL